MILDYNRTKLTVYIFLACLLVLSGALYAGSYQIVTNYDFTLDADGEVNMEARGIDNTLGWTGSGWTDVRVPSVEGAPLPPNGLDIAARISYDHWSHDLYQNTGAAIQPDTVYTLTFDARPLTYVWALVLEWYADDAYVGLAREYATLNRSGGDWSSHEVTFDSADYPHAVGKELGLRFFISAEEQGGGRVLITNVKLDPLQPFLITEQPQDQMALVNQTAVLEASVGDTGSALAYQWYRSVDSFPDPSEDTLVHTGTIVDGRAVYEIPAVESEDQGYYYCIISDGSSEVYSTVSMLTVGEQLSHWTLDADDFVDGLYLDSLGSRHAVPQQAPPAGAFVAGMVNDGLDVGNYPAAAATAGTDSPADFTGQMSVALWVNWNGPNGWQGIVSKRQGDNASQWHWDIDPDGTSMNVSSWAGSELSAEPPAIGQWVHLALTVDGNGATLYKNGEIESVQTGFVLGEAPNAELILGGLHFTEQGGIYGSFNGVIDDVRIYNYAMDQLEIAELVFDDSGIRACIEEYRPELDWTGDCYVAFGDFSELADYWLHDGLTSVED